MMGSQAAPERAVRSMISGWVSMFLKIILRPLDQFLYLSDVHYGSKESVQGASVAAFVANCSDREVGVRPSLSKFLGAAGLTTRIVATALCALLVAGVAGAESGRPADTTISEAF